MGQVKVTLVRSPAGRLPRHRECVRALGLSRLQKSVTLADTPAVRGLIAHVAYLLRVEEL